MARTFKPPYHVEADYYDAKGKIIEWAEHWGTCPDAKKILYRVLDQKDQTIASRYHREDAQRIADSLNATAPPSRERGGK